MSLALVLKCQTCAKGALLHCRHHSKLHYCPPPHCCPETKYLLSPIIFPPPELAKQCREISLPAYWSNMNVPMQDHHPFQLFQTFAKKGYCILFPAQYNLIQLCQCGRWTINNHSSHVVYVIMNSIGLFCNFASVTCTRPTAVVAQIHLNSVPGEPYIVCVHVMIYIAIHFPAQ